MRAVTSRRIKKELLLYMSKNNLPMKLFKNAYRKAKEAHNRGEI